MKKLFVLILMLLGASIFADKRIVASCMDVEAGPTMYVLYLEDKCLECISREGADILFPGENGYDVPYGTLLTLMGIYQMNGGDYIHPIQVGTSVLLVRNYE